MDRITSIRLGIVTGLFIGILIVAFLLKFTKNDGKLKAKYDERQEIARGRGYMYAFFTLLIYLGFTVILDAMEIYLPFSNGFKGFLGIAVGIVVYAVYAIFHDAYFSLNENRGKIMYVLFFIGLFNIFIGCVNIIEHRALDEGVVSIGAINLLCGIIFVVIFIALWIKKCIDKKEAGTDEES